jgi:hypothetical protein
MQKQTNISAKAKSDRAAKLAAAKARNAAAQAAKAAAPATDAPAPADVTRLARLQKRAETCLARAATNFTETTDRDDAYTALFGAIARAVKSDTITIADILAHAPHSTAGKPINPLYSGASRAAADGGVLNRICGSGRFTRAADGKSLTVTTAGKSLACYSAFDIADRKLAARKQA